MRKTSKKREIFETLTEEIASGDIPPGSRVPSVRELAERFGTSVYPVHRALSKLRDQGYVVTEPRAGTYVADPTRPFQLSETVVLGLGTRSHVWGELDLMLATRLHEDGLVPLTVNADSEEGRERLISLARSDAQAIVIRGRWGFPFQMFKEPPFTDTIVVGVVEWTGPEMEECLRVLSDFQEGGRIVAEHLQEQGHRNVLLVAPQWHQIVDVDGSPADLGHLDSFRREWEANDGHWQGLTTEGWEDREPILDQDKLFSLLDPKGFGATAVFGYMDVVVWKVQQILRDERPDWLEKVELVGYFDTPWSHAAHPSFSTINLNLEQIADETCNLLEQALANPESVDNPTRMVRPRLVVREN